MGSDFSLVCFLGCFFLFEILLGGTEGPMEGYRVGKVNAKVHAYDNDDDPIYTACGRKAYDLTSQGALAEPPLLLISRDWNMIDCQTCIKVWNIGPSYGLWRAVAKHMAKESQVR